MTTVGIFQAKARLSHLIQEVNAGREVVITRHGEPVARLVPARRAPGIQRRKLVAEIKRFRKSLRVRRVNVRSLIEEGRD